MGPSEEYLLEELRRLQYEPEAQRQLLQEIWEEDSPMVQKAARNYKIVTSRLNCKPVDESDFIAGYIDSCCENAVLAAGAGRASREVSFDGKLNTIYLCWHFRDYPAIRSTVLHLGPLVLIAQRAGWMKELHDAGLTLNFRSGGSISKLLRTMRSGKPIIAMFDYCYEETRFEIANFLSYPAKTPVGILHLAKKFDYEVRAIGPVGNRISTIAYFDKVKDVSVCAAEINATISDWILKKPTEWLMWPALGQRLTSELN